MRNIILTGVVAAALLASTGVQAFPGGSGGFFGSDCKAKVGQLQCATNEVEKRHHGSNDHNAQFTLQLQGAKVKHTPEHVIQYQNAKNIVEKGDWNYQEIDQGQLLNDKSHGHDGGGMNGFNNNNHGNSLDHALQTQYATNTVEGGNGNTQVIVQGQALEIGSSHHQQMPE